MALTEVRPHSVVAEDGTEREVDTIIFGTGFHVTDVPIADRVSGRDGRTLAETWNGSMQAYKGTTVAGYPNLFFLVGPNTGLGHTSIVFMIESQINYVLGRAAHDASPRREHVEVRAEAQTAYNAELDRMTEGTVWVSGGCTSYYIDRNGHNSALWPTFTWPFRQRTREFDEGAYALGARVSADGGERERAARRTLEEQEAPALAASRRLLVAGPDLVRPVVRALAGAARAAAAGDATGAAAASLRRRQRLARHHAVRGERPEASRHSATAVGVAVPRAKRAHVR